MGHLRVNTYDVIGNILRSVVTVGARRAGGAGGAARHADAVNYGRQEIGQIYTSACTNTKNLLKWRYLMFGCRLVILCMTIHVA